jgi:hypothetical protein
MQKNSQIKDYLNKNFIKVNIDVTKENEYLIYQQFGEWHMFLIIPGVKFEQPVHLEFQVSDPDRSSYSSNFLVAVDECLENALPSIRTVARTGNQWAQSYLRSKGSDW